MNIIDFLLLYLNMENEWDILEIRALFVLTAYLFSTTLQTRNFITTTGLQKSSISAGYHLYLHGTNSDYTSAMGIDCTAFNCILHHFSDFYIVLSGPGQPGRPTRLLSKGTVLACLLHFYAGT